MIKSFKLFESYSEIKSICDRYHVENWELNPETGLVDVFGDVGLQYSSLKKLPLKFGIVSGGFYCHHNQLTSLEGAPQSVGGDFYCYENQLTSLEGAPQIVGGDFDCYNNQLTTLEGSPKSVGGNFDVYKTQLVTLSGGPNSVGGNFICNHNKLTSLEGSPQTVGGDFYCNNNQIKDFKVPEYSLNEERDFYCTDNPIHEIYKLFNTPKCIDLINEFEVVGGGQISRVKLEEVFLELGLEIPKDLRFKNYKLI